MDRECGMWINIVSHKLKKQVNITMQSLGLTAMQSHVMHYILVKCADGPVFQRDVESAFGMNRSTATGILQVMEKNGLISRESVASDARLKSLIPTEKAQQLDAKIGEYLRQTEQRITQDMTEEQVEGFINAAERMAENIDR